MFRTKLLRCRRTDADKANLIPFRFGRENTTDDGRQVGTVITGAPVLNRGVGSPADALPRRSVRRPESWHGLEQLVSNRGTHAFLYPRAGGHYPRRGLRASRHPGALRLRLAGWLQAQRACSA